LYWNAVTNKQKNSEEMLEQLNSFSLQKEMTDSDFFYLMVFHFPNSQERDNFTCWEYSYFTKCYY